MPNVVLLGSTGSIGTQTLNVIEHLDGHYAVNIIGLSGFKNIALLANQVQQFNPQYVWVPDNTAKQELLSRCKNHKFKILIGDEGLSELASISEVDWIINGIVGFAGLAPTLSALKAGKKLLTANKESIVCAGHLIQPYLEQIIPLDSEHSAIYQCLQGCKNPETEVSKLYLTASGGPFRELPLNQFSGITPAMALKHPKWTMGNRISIDSATMMNKAFERIEAHVLFNMPYEKIEMVIHPQSIVHSAVAYCDGSIIAQMGEPDMRVPLLYGLSSPHRWPSHDASMHLDLTQLGALDFSAVEPERYPCLSLANDAVKQGGSLLTALNSADEVLVQAFIEGKITWVDIPQKLETILKQHQDSCYIQTPSAEEILAIDTQTREQAQKLISHSALVA